MYHAGMSGVRINTAYGDASQYRGIIESVREIGEIPIIVDVKGPEIRIRAKKRTVREGEVFEVDMKIRTCAKSNTPIRYRDRIVLFSFSLPL
jgi:pyruvate kinase